MGRELIIYRRDFENIVVDKVLEELRNEKGFGEKRLKIVERAVLNAINYALKGGGDYMFVKDIE